MSLRRTIRVKMSQDIYSDSRWHLNLKQLRKNKLKKPDKTGGRKRPRTLDVDVVAAGDTGDSDLERVHTLIQPVDNMQASDVEQDVEPDNIPATAVDRVVDVLTCATRAAPRNRQHANDISRRKFAGSGVIAARACSTPCA